MDRKAKQLLNHYHQRLIQNSFDEKDIYGLLILIRGLSKSNSPVRELGDFIAHREKDRGYIKKYLLETKNKLDNLGKINTTIVIKPVFTAKEILNDLNNIFILQKLTKINDKVANEIMLCIISLLQDVQIFNGRDVLGKLVIVIKYDVITLFGKIRLKNNSINVVFPVLEGENTIFLMPISKEHQSPNGIIEIINVDNHHVLKFIDD